jgi:glycosyltransferase involved in cell wall biosynthesis
VNPAVGTVISVFRRALPRAQIYVHDNNSSDRTAAVARAAGAQIRSERRQGKGRVVRRMFADVDADIYVLVDGDATYDAASAPRMIAALIDDHLDMVVGLRVDQTEAAYRPGHRFRCCAEACGGVSTAADAAAAISSPRRIRRRMTSLPGQHLWMCHAGEPAGSRQGDRDDKIEVRRYGSMPLRGAQQRVRGTCERRLLLFKRDCPALVCPMT